MRFPVSIKSVVPLLLLLVAVAFVDRIHAAVVTIKGKGKVAAEQQLYSENVPGGGSRPLLTVPADRELIVTDLIVINSSATDATLRLSDDFPGTNQAPDIFVAAKTTFAHAFTVGLEIGPDVILTATNIGAGTSQITVYVGGYLKKT